MAKAVTSGRLLVGAQFALIGYFILFHPLGLPIGWFPVALFTLGIGLGIWSLLFMRERSRVRITPAPGEGTRLLASGPYRFIRHPMYLSVLLITLSLVADFPALPHFLAFGALLVVLLLKLNLEERLLLSTFPEYATYRARTKRLLPLVY